MYSSHEHVVPHSVLVVREPKASYLGYCKGAHGRAVDPREPVFLDVGDNYDCACSALGHVLHDVSHHDRRWETVTEGRFLPAWVNGHVVAKNIYPR